MTLSGIILSIILVGLIFGSSIKEAWDIHIRDIFRKDA